MFNVGLARGRAGSTVLSVALVLSVFLSLGSTSAVTPAFGSDTYKVNFVANGGAGSMSDQSGSSSATLSPNMFTRTGYTFDGWNTVDDGKDGTAYSDEATYDFSAD
ncbi:InlB B-repeat-containing protein, partial [Pontimonas sp.]|nr:InlB B-repeat-containing protein [Pontimonas sp.]